MFNLVTGIERHKSEWVVLLKQSDRKKWKHHIRDYLKNKLLTEHCGTLEKNDIKAAYERDDAIVGKLIKDNVRKRASPQGNIHKWTSC